MIVDAYQRTFKTLRISLTGLCNLGCVYCVSSTDKQPTQVKKTLSASEIVALTHRLHNILDLKTIRLTGGEPSLYPELVGLIKGLSQLGVALKMTTNAYHLEHLVKPMYDAGLKELNISLDAVSEATFRKVSHRKNLDKVLNTIDTCQAMGYALKLNTVIVKGINEHELMDILQFGKDRNIPVRFLELMKMGHLYSSGFDNHFFSEQEMLDTIKQSHSFVKDIRHAHATAHYFSMDDGYKFGVIANESEPFCSDCNRLRLDAFGNVYGCLSDNNPIGVSNPSFGDFDLNEKLHQALAQKQVSTFKGSDLSMMAIGG